MHTSVYVGETVGGTLAFLTHEVCIVSDLLLHTAIVLEKCNDSHTQLKSDKQMCAIAICAALARFFEGHPSRGGVLLGLC